ncbi:50S ribosomal protein L29 [Thermithiobacillus plumbiphilus]|uniref:Large ribosomal subunit protein uL29 n=1 Tax=Thermithiobacillus plumbiphilus TaxID=1729899 RepID=A0ABU9DAE9_9PROT
MNTNELRGKSGDALQQELISLLDEQFKLRMQHASAQLQNTARLRAVRRDIARVRTLIREK